MTTRSHRLGGDLTADLLADLAEEQTLATPAVAETARGGTQPFVETTLYLLPTGWLRPGVIRANGGFALSAGPLRLTAGRR